MHIIAKLPSMKVEWITILVQGHRWVVQRICDTKEGADQVGWSGQEGPPAWALALTSFGNVYCTTYQWCKMEPINEEFSTIPASSHLWRCWCNNAGLFLPARAVFTQLSQSPPGLKWKNIGIGSFHCSLVTWCSPEAVWVWLLLFI